MSHCLRGRKKQTCAPSNLAIDKKGLAFMNIGIGKLYSIYENILL